MMYIVTNKKKNIKKIKKKIYKFFAVMDNKNNGYVCCCDVCLVPMHGDIHDNLDEFGVDRVIQCVFKQR